MNVKDVLFRMVLHIFYILEQFYNSDFGSHLVIQLFSKRIQLLLVNLKCSNVLLADCPASVRNDNF